MSLLRLHQRLPLISCRRPMPVLLGSLLALSVFSGSAAHAAGTVNQPTEAALDQALAGGGTVTIACDGTIPITSTKNITADTTIDATGHNITLDGGNNTQIFNAVGSGILYFDPTQIVLQWLPTRLNFTLNHVTLAHGGANNGSAISLGATNLTVSNCTFLNNAATGSGTIYGGVHTFMSTLTPATLTVGNLLTITDSVFSGNTAVNSGAAISTVSNTIFINRSAFLNNTLTNNSNNTAIPFNPNGGNATGGAIGQTSQNSLSGPQPFLTVADSTFAGNGATAGGNGNARGGAIFTDDTTVALTNCTIARNFVKAVNGEGGGQGNGGGINNAALVREFRLTNTIVSKNTATNAGGNAVGIFKDGGHNMSSDNSFAFTTDVNMKPTSVNNTDPRLGSLVYTGGATPTLELKAGSPAIDAGDDNAVASIDQRHAPRPQGAHSDIGAYERPIWQAQAISQGTGNNTTMLWNHYDGMIDLWNVDSSTGNISSSYVYGPYVISRDANNKPIDVWTAVDVAVGPDGNPRVLWTSPDGSVVFWEVDKATGIVIATPLYNHHQIYPDFPVVVDPNVNWSAIAISVGADNNTRLLWRNIDGRIDLWNLNDNNGTISNFHIYGALAGRTAVDLAVGPDNKSHILWNKTDSTVYLWNVDTSANTFTEQPYTPDTPAWTGASISVGADNNTRLLWNNLDGTNALYNLDAITGNIIGASNLGVYSGWAARTIAVGADNQTRILWNNGDGTQDLWMLNASINALSASVVFGPYDD